MTEPRPPREELEARAAALLRDAGENENLDLVRELVVSVSRLAWEDATHLDLKILGSAVRELRHSFRVFAPYRDARKVCVFGSARTPADTPLYRLAEETGRRIVRSGMMVITGAGGGVMEAANKGAGPAGGFGLAIRLPFEPDPNPYVRRPDRLINFKYFFTRKLVFVKESDAVILLPGGFGTNDECFELLTLLQTGKGDPRPVVLLDVEGGTYWDTWLEFVRRELAGHGYIDGADLDLLTLCRTTDEAIEEIRRFYRIYHSSRDVGDRRMFRLERPLTATELESLGQEFADIILEGSLEACPVLEPDRTDPYLGRLHPVWFRFDRRRFSRLRQLIDRMNAL